MLEARDGAVVCSCGNLIQKLQVVGNAAAVQTLSHPACGREPQGFINFKTGVPVPPCAHFWQEDPIAPSVVCTRCGVRNRLW